MAIAMDLKESMCLNLTNNIHYIENGDTSKKLHFTHTNVTTRVHSIVSIHAV